MKIMRMKYLLYFCLSAIIELPSLAQSKYKIGGIPFELTAENKPLAVNIKNNKLVLEADSLTDMFRDPNVTYNTDNAPKLLFTPDTDFVLSCSIEHGFHSKWDGGAIVLISDSIHWIKFCFEKDYKLKNRVVSVVTRNVSDDCNSAEIPSKKVFYKMARSGNVVTLYYSTDGKDWTLVRHLQMNVKDPVQVGFLAQSPTGRSCKVVFDDIRYEAKKIKDPYAGQ